MITTRNVEKTPPYTVSPKKKGEMSTHTHTGTTAQHNCPAGQCVSSSEEDEEEKKEREDTTGGPRTGIQEEEEESNSEIFLVEASLPPSCGLPFPTPTHPGNKDGGIHPLETYTRYPHPTTHAFFVPSFALLKPTSSGGVHLGRGVPATSHMSLG